MKAFAGSVLLFLFVFSFKQSPAQTENAGKNLKFEISIGYSAHRFSDQKITASVTTRHGDPWPNLFSFGFVSELNTFSLSAGRFYFFNFKDINALKRGDMVERKAGYLDLTWSRRLNITQASLFLKAGIGFQSNFDIPFLHIGNPWERNQGANEYSTILVLGGIEYSRRIVVDQLHVVVGLNGRAVCWNDFNSLPGFETFRFAADGSLALRYSFGNNRKRKEPTD